MPERTGWQELRDRRMGESGASEAYDAARLAFDLGRRVRELRVQQGVSQTELARRAGMTQPAVARFEAGGTVPTLPVLERLARALGAELTVSAADGAAEIVGDVRDQAKLGAGWQSLCGAELAQPALRPARRPPGERHHVPRAAALLGDGTDRRWGRRAHGGGGATTSLPPRALRRRTSRMAATYPHPGPQMPAPRKRLHRTTTLR